MKRLLFRDARLLALEEENRELKAANETLLREWENQKGLIEILTNTRDVLGNYICDLKKERNELRKMIEDFTVTLTEEQKEGLKLTPERYQILRDRIHVVSMRHAAKEANPREFIETLQRLGSAKFETSSDPLLEEVISTLTAEALIRWNTKLLEAVND